MSAVLPSASLRPPELPVTPCPVTDWNAVTSGIETPRSRHRRRSHARAGVHWHARVLPRGQAPPAPKTRARAMTRSSTGRPSVSVPVLSTTSVSTVRSVSIAAALRNRTPSCAPRPLATMIEMGVASPSAQGQAMISTATALTSAYARRGSGPTDHHATESHHRDGDDRRHEPGGDASASRCSGARERCASATSATICASRLAAPDAFGFDDERAGLIDRRADDAVARRPSRPGAARRSTSIRRRSSVPRRRGHRPASFRRDAHARGRRRRSTSSRHVLLGSIGTDASGSLRCETQELADCSARAAARLRVRAIHRAAPARRWRRRPRSTRAPCRARRASPPGNKLGARVATRCRRMPRSRRGR